MQRFRAATLLCSLVACGFEVGGGVTRDGGDGDSRRDDAMADAGDGGGGPPFVRMIDLDDGDVIGGPHLSFPLLIAVSAPWLRVTSSGGRVAHPSAFDLHFSMDAAGLSALDHELEAYDGSTGELVAWVRLPSLSSTTVLFMHYGDPAITTSQEDVAAVWSAGFAGVWHLVDGRDATGLNGIATVSGATAAAGKLGRARRFDATDDYVDVGSATAIDDVFAGGGTAEGWMFATGWGEASYGRLFDKGHAGGWSYGLNDVGPLSSIYYLHGASGQGRWDTAGQSIALNRWTHVALVYDQGDVSNDATWYIDGTAVATTRSQTPSGTIVSDAAAPLYLGNRPGLDRTFDGTLDELRLSSVARSAGWLATSFRNQSDPAGFHTIGPEQ